MQKRRYALTFARPGVTKLSLASRVLTYRMQLADKHLTAGVEHADSLRKNYLQMLDMFQN